MDRSHAFVSSLDHEFHLRSPAIRAHDLHRKLGRGHEQQGALGQSGDVRRARDKGRDGRLGRVDGDAADHHAFLSEETALDSDDRRQCVPAAAKRQTNKDFLREGLRSSDPQPQNSNDKNFC